MTELRDLYQEVILDHYKRPRNFGKPDRYTSEAEGHNPLCGDEVSIFLNVENGRIRDIHFTGKGCAISTASASVMTEALAGKDVSETHELFEKFHNLVTGKGGVDPVTLGKLAVFAGVQEFPLRVKCASLAWHTLRAALEERKDKVSTE